MVSDVGADTGGFETDSSGAGVEAEEASSVEDVVTCKVEVNSTGAGVEAKEASSVEDVVTCKVQVNSTGAAVETEEAASVEDVVTCEVEVNSFGATVEMDDSSLNKDEFVTKACSLGVRMSAVVAGGVDVGVRTGTDELFDTAKGLTLYAFHLWWLR